MAWFPCRLALENSWANNSDFPINTLNTKVNHLPGEFEWQVKNIYHTEKSKSAHSWSAYTVI